MNEEIFNAAIMRLRSRALEHYGIIKDLARRPPGEGTVDELVKNAITLVQFEGAMLTLQQYMPTITSELEEEAREKLEAEQEEDDSPSELSEEELSARSSSSRRTQKAKKKTKK